MMHFPVMVARVTKLITLRRIPQTRLHVASGLRLLKASVPCPSTSSLKVVTLTVPRSEGRATGGTGAAIPTEDCVRSHCAKTLRSGGFSVIAALYTAPD